MRFGYVASVLLHLILVGSAYLFLPSLATKVIETPFVPVSIIAQAEIADELSVPEMAPQVDPKPPEEPKPAVEEAPKVSEAPPPEPAPTPEKKPDPKPEPLKAPEKKPDPVKPKPKTDELDLDALSAVIDKEKQKQPASSGAPLEADRPQQRIGAGVKLTATEEAKMQAAIRRCWNLNALAGAPDAKSLVVVAAFELNRDGTLSSPPRSVNGPQIALSGNRFWKAAEQTALRAIVQCQPYDFLSPERYDVWREMELNFDPSVAAGF